MPFYLSAPESTSSECGFQSQPARLGSNPVTSAALDSLLTFLCLRVSICGTRTSTPNSEDGGGDERNVAGVWPSPTCPHWVR